MIIQGCMPPQTAIPKAGKSHYGTCKTRFWNLSLKTKVFFRATSMGDWFTEERTSTIPSCKPHWIAGGLNAAETLLDQYWDYRRGIQDATWQRL